MEVNEYCAIEGTDLPQMVFNAERKVLSDLFFKACENDNLTEEEADKINAFIEMAYAILLTRKPNYNWTKL